MGTESRPLPNGWRRVRLGDLCQERTGTRDPRVQPENTFRYVDITSVDNISKRITTPKVLLGSGAPSRARQIIRSQDVLVATTRPNLNAVALVPPELDNAVCSTGFCVLRANPELDPHYLFAFVQCGEFVENLSEAVRGAMYPAVTEDQVRRQLVPLPPMEEQKRIATILTEQMTSVGRARRSVEAQLKTAEALPAAYLRAVFCSPEARQWPSRKLSEVGEIVSGVTLGRRLNGAQTRTVPYLRVANVKDGYLDLSDVYEIEATDAEIRKCVLRYGDLLLTEGGDPDKLGRGTFWADEISECIHQNHIFRVRFDLHEALPEFMSAQMASPYGKAYFLARAKQTTGIATINQKVLGNFPLMMPTIRVQHVTVEMLKRQMAAAEQARTAIEETLNATKALPAVLLRRAFNGEL
jgi:type I restriction enzyme, S subunit